MAALGMIIGGIVAICVGCCAYRWYLRKVQAFEDAVNDKIMGAVGLGEDQQQQQPPPQPMQPMQPMGMPMMQQPGMMQPMGMPPMGMGMGATHTSSTTTTTTTNMMRS